MPWIKVLSGDIPGSDTPTKCHGPRCRAHTDQPGRHGWKLIATDFPFAAMGAVVNGVPYDANGWWCQKCCGELEPLIKELALEVTSQDVYLPPDDVVN